MGRPVAIDPGSEPLWARRISVKTCFAIAELTLIGPILSPQIFVRFLALKSETEIPKGATVAFVWTLPPMQAPSSWASLDAPHRSRLQIGG